MTSFSFGIQPQQTTQASAFNFGTSTTSSGALNLSTQPFQATNSSMNAPFGGTAATGFGTTQTAPTFSSSLSTASAFPAVSNPVSSGVSFGAGFGAPTATAAFGTNPLVPAAGATLATPSTTTATVGLGGVDIQAATGLDGGNIAGKRDGKSIKETQIPNEIAVTVESFKKYVKEQKVMREEMSRASSKNIFKVQELVMSLKQQLSVVCNGVHRNASAIAKLKEGSNQELKNVEIAQRTKDSLSLQYENNAPTEYFHNLANNFEKQMHLYRQQIEQLERHLVSLSQPYTLTPTEWIAIRRRLHDTFVTLAAQLQTVHQEVQLFKENFINHRRASHGDVRMFLEKRKHNMRAASQGIPTPSAVTYGPSPFAVVQSAVGKTISNAFHSPLTGAGTTLGSLGLSSFDGVGVQNAATNLSLPRPSAFQNASSFKPLGQTAVVPPMGSSVGFGSDPTSQFGLDNQKPFQLQKPPAGNKRGKRWTST